MVSRYQDGIVQKPPDDKTRHEQRDSLCVTLQKQISQGFSNSLDLQAAIIDYLQIREHEEALHLPATPVPHVLVPYFQQVTLSDLQKEVNRLVVFPSSSASSDAQSSAQSSTEDTSQKQQSDNQGSPNESDKQEKSEPMPEPEMHLAPVNLGTDINSSQRIMLEQKQRQGGTYVIGKTRSGKTTLLVNIILQDIEQGLGVCYLDPHGDAINDILARLPSHRGQDVVLLDMLDTVYPFGLNLYECADLSDDGQVTRTVDYLEQIFAKLFADGDLSKTPQLAQVLRNTAYTLIENPGMTMAELPLLLDDEDARTRLVKNVSNSHVLQFWRRYERRKDQTEFTGSTINRLDAFLINKVIWRIVGQSKTTINFRDMMDKGKILLVKLSAKHEQMSNLLGAVLIGQLLNAAYSRSDIPFEKRRQFNLYADEYQRFATPDFVSLLTEAGKFGIATTIAHQTRSQLDYANKGATKNAANIIVFPVIGDDAEELKDEFTAVRQELPGHFRPGRVRHEQVMEMEMEEYLEDGWRDEGAAEQHRKASTKLIDIEKNHSTELMKGDILVNLLSVHEDSIGDNLSVYYPTTLYHKLNPAYIFFFQPQLLGKLQRKFDFIPFSPSPQELAFLNPEENEQFYRLADPFNVLSGAEMALEQLTQNKLENIDKLKYADYLLTNIRRLLVQYRRDAIYRLVHLPLVRMPQSPTSQERRNFDEAAWTNAQRHQDLESKGYFRYTTYNHTLGEVENWYWKIYEYPDIHKFLEAEAQPVLSYYYSARSLRAEMQELSEKYWGEVTKIRPTGRMVPLYQRTSSGFGRSARTERSPVYTEVQEPSEYIPGGWESMADAQKLVAQKLATLEKYTACCKLHTSEYTIRIDKLREPDTESVVQTRTQKIIAQTRKLYCKKREDVEQEIADRQKELLKPVKKERKTQQEEDEDKDE